VLGLGWIERGEYGQEAVFVGADHHHSPGGEQENARLKKLVADLFLDNAILKEVDRGNF